MARVMVMGQLSMAATVLRATAGTTLAANAIVGVVAVVEAAAPNVTILGPRFGGQTVVIASPAKPADDHHGQPPEPKVLDHKGFFQTGPDGGG